MIVLLPLADMYLPVCARMLYTLFHTFFDTTKLYILLTLSNKIVQNFVIIDITMPD